MASPSLTNADVAVNDTSATREKFWFMIRKHQDNRVLVFKKDKKNEKYFQTSFLDYQISFFKNRNWYKINYFETGAKK